MKKSIILALLVIASVQIVNAKKANAVWYFLAKTDSSISQDENISVQYGIYTKFANENYNLGPYPTMRIKVINKTDSIIYVDLGTSYIKKNDIATVIFTPTITSTMTGQSMSVGVNMGAVADAVGIIVKLVASKSER